MPRAILESEYGFGDIVYLKIRDDYMPGMITRITFTLTGIVYDVTWSNGYSTLHYAMELSTEYEPFSANVKEG